MMGVVAVDVAGLIAQIKEAVFEVGTVVIEVPEPYNKQQVIEILQDWTYSIKCEDGITIVFPFIKKGVQLLDTAIVVFDTDTC